MENHEIWNCLCLSVALLFTLTTLIVYVVVPELKSLQGSLLRRYLVTYIGYCVTWVLICSSFFELLHEKDVDGTYRDSVMIYLGVFTTLWLNVISFNICRTFRNMPVSRHVNLRVDQYAKLIRYSVYAWGSPFVLFTLNISLSNIVERLHISKEAFFVFTRIVGVALSVSVAICNIFFYILTALAIKKRIEETAHIVDGIHRNHRENEQWFNLYVKLFIVMGVRAILWIILPLVQNTKYRSFFLTSEALDSVCVFLIFVWKDDVKLSSRKQFSGMISTADSILPCHSTPSTVENEDQNKDSKVHF